MAVDVTPVDPLVDLRNVEVRVLHPLPPGHHQRRCDHLGRVRVRVKPGADPLRETGNHLGQPAVHHHQHPRAPRAAAAAAQDLAQNPVSRGKHALGEPDLMPERDGQTPLNAGMHPRNLELDGIGGQFINPACRRAQPHTGPDAPT
jgi:hypothetical protein